MESPPNLATAKEVATRLRLSVAAVYALCDAGELRHYKFGTGRKRRAIRIDLASVDAYQSRCEVVPVQAPAVERKAAASQTAGFSRLRALGWTPPAAFKVVS